MFAPLRHRKSIGTTVAWSSPWSLAVLILLLVVAASCRAAEPPAPPTTSPAGARVEPIARSGSAPIESEALTAATQPTVARATPTATTAPLPSVTVEPVSATLPTPTVPPTVPAEQSPTPTDTVRATGETENMVGGVPAPSADQSTGVYQPRRGVIAIDPGHGGPEPGAAAHGVVEKDVNLRIALKLADRLREAGLTPVLTRDSDRAVHPDYDGGGYSGGLRSDLQARVDIANEAGAVLFISIHNNGHNDPSVSGTEVWYNNARPFSDRNVALARLVLEHLVEEIRGLGYPVQNRGIKDDANFRIFRGRAYNIYVLSPGTGPREHVPTQMPGVLGESLFVSNPTEAALLRQERTLDAIAQGYFRAIQAYLAEYEQ